MNECESARAGVDRLRDGTLPAEERRHVIDHLRSACASCATWLAEVDAGEILVLLAGDAAALTDVERRRMLSAVLAEAPRRRRPWLASGLALAAALALVAVVAGRDRWTGEKGAGAAPIALAVSPIVGRLEGGRPQVLRRWARGEPLAPGELLLFRLELDRPAYVYLIAEDGAGRRQVLHAPRAALPAGEHELTENDQALALDPRALGGRAHLRWLAAPGPLDDPTSCRSCTAVELEVQAP